MSAIEIGLQPCAAEVLDLGCNIGGFCFVARELGASYAVGIDT